MSNKLQLYCTIKDYKKITKILLSYTKHINLICNDFIISTCDKNKYLTILNSITVKINKEYNIIMSLLGDISSEYDDMVDDTTIRIEYKSYKINKIIDKSNVHNLYNNYNRFFINSTNIILNNIANKIGFPSLKTLIFLLYGGSYKILCTNEISKHIKYINNIFVPLNHKSKTVQFTSWAGKVENFGGTTWGSKPEWFGSTSPEKNLNKFLEGVGRPGGSISQHKNFSNFCDELGEPVSTSLYDNIKIEKVKTKTNFGYNIHNNGKITILINNKINTIKGYFLNNTTRLILKTSQISNNHIFDKHKEKTNFIHGKINHTFERNYLKHINIVDILVLTNEEFIDQLSNEFEEYDKTINMSFMDIINDFKINMNMIKNSKDIDIIKKICDTIKYYLIGSIENINTGSMLYELTKKYILDDNIVLVDIININMDSELINRIVTKNIHKSTSLSDLDIKKQLVLEKQIPINIKKIILMKIDEVKNSSTDYHKHLVFIDTLINFPWYCNEISYGKSKSHYLTTIKHKFDELIYGHNESKNHIIEILGKWITNPSNNGNTIGLVGPPGTGKTLFAKALSQSLDIPFAQITLGGQNDGDLLYGHSFAYSGAQPGIIVKKMCEMGKARCIIYFDELDKACKKNDTNEIYNILIHLIDPNTNESFHDRFFHELAFPLNKVLFIFSYNDSSLIDKILLDRITEINILPYNKLDKINITKKHLLDEMNIMINRNDIQIDDDCIEHIIDNYTNEPGIRELGKQLERIFMKINIEQINNNMVCKITKDMIAQYLGLYNNLSFNLFAIDKSFVGITNGLYVTKSYDCGILPIQIKSLYGNINNNFLLLTGNQQKIMNESVNVAYTLATNIIKPTIIDNFFNKCKYGLHIHVPYCEVPKDGGSAGLAFVVAFISFILDIPINNTFAFTGEIDLFGNINKVCNIKSKMFGGHKYGIKTIFLPNKNKPDIDVINGLVNGLTIIYVDNISEILLELFKSPTFFIKHD